MKNNKKITDVLSEIADPFLYKIISTKNLTEKEMVMAIMRKIDKESKIKPIMSLLEYLIEKIYDTNDFFDEELKKCIILKGDYIIMYELLRHSEVDIFNEKELQEIYKGYANYEIRSLVEAKLWARL